MDTQDDETSTSTLIVKLPVKKSSISLRSTQHYVSTKKEYNRLMKQKERANMSY